MNNPIPAIYENGVLRPLVPLRLSEQTHVQIYVEFPGNQAAEHTRQVRDALIAAGLSLPRSDTSCGSHELSPERREYLARLFSPGQPLSEIIIAERERHSHGNFENCLTLGR